MRDRLTPVSVATAVVIIFLSMFLDGGNPMVLFKPAPLLLVFGGTLAVSLAGLLKQDLKNLKSIFKQAMGKEVPDFQDTIDTLYELAKFGKANKDNLRDLPEKAQELSDDPFLLRGCGMIADSKGADEIRETMEEELDGMEARHSAASKFFVDMGGFSPTLGILGTVIGLVHVLGNLSNPGELGPGIASAFTATLWGVLAANVFWLPIANKLQRISSLESRIKTVQIEGVIGILHGTSSRALRDRMQAYLPAKERLGAAVSPEDVAA